MRHSLIRSFRHSFIPPFRHSAILPLAAILLLPNALSAQAPAMRIEPLAPGFHLISGYANGNIVALVGREAVLLVDGQSGRRVGLADSALRTVTALPVRLVINTHYHEDHIQGNAHWRAAGASVMAHAALADEARKDTTIAELEWHRTPAAAEALPDRTFRDSTAFEFEGQLVILLHPPAAHTRTDAVVWFPRANLIHTGDILEREAPPFVDWWAGGTVDGMIAACDRILALADARTVIVPGHGTPTDRQGLARYRAMLAAARERIGARLRAGATPDVIVAERPLAEWEADLGGERRAARFVRQVAAGLR